MGSSTTVTQGRSANAPRLLRPVTERILGRLPGPRVAWIAVWALVLAQRGANLLCETGARSAVWDQSRTLVLVNYTALSLAIVITLWGPVRIARRLENLRATTGKLLNVYAAEAFREVNSVAGPLVASAAGAIAFGISAFVADGWTSAILRASHGSSSGSRSGPFCGRTLRYSWV